jgi:transposase
MGRHVLTDAQWLHLPPLLPPRKSPWLIRQAGHIADRTFEIEFLDADVEIYTFTFG